MTDIINFDQDGQIIDGDLSETRIYATQTNCVDGSRYFVLVFGGQIVNPEDMGGRVKQDSPRLKMASVPEEVFLGYLSFLRGKEQRKLLQIRRIQRGA